MSFDPLSPGYRLLGEKVYLRPITGRDTEMVLAWRNADFVRDHFFYRTPISVSEHERWLAEKVGKGLVFQFIVYLTEGDIPVGSIYLQNYDNADNSMESGLFFDEKAPGGRGVATESYGLVTGVFAKDIGLSRLRAQIIADNRGSIRVHEKCGFTLKRTFEKKVIPTGESVIALEYVKEID